MAGIEAVLLDLGSTLIYFEGDWPQVAAEADRELFTRLKRAGLELDEESFLQEFRARLNAYYEQRESEFIEYTTEYVLRTLLEEWGHADLPEAVIRPALDKMYAASQSHWHAEEDAIPTLETLRQRGYEMGVVSNAGDDGDVQTLVDNAGLRGYLDFVLTSAACSIRKPNPRIFLMALSHWGVAPEQAVMVGDTLGADILGARNAGIFSIWITRRADTPGNRDHADTIQPDATIATLSELPALLVSLG